MKQNGLKIALQGASFKELCKLAWRASDGFSLICSSFGAIDSSIQIEGIVEMSRRLCLIAFLVASFSFFAPCSYAGAQEAASSQDSLGPLVRDALTCLLMGWIGIFIFRRKMEKMSGVGSIELLRVALGLCMLAQFACFAFPYFFLAALPCSVYFVHEMAVLLAVRRPKLLAAIAAVPLLNLAPLLVLSLRAGRRLQAEAK